MRLLGKGLFRTGYKVKGCDLVIKFPGCEVEDLWHSRQEVRRLNRLKKAGVLREFLPEIFFYDKKTGVIAMRYYREFVNFEKQADAMGRMIQKLIYRLTRVKCTDIHTENVRSRNIRDAVLIDLGY